MAIVKAVVIITSIVGAVGIVIVCISGVPNVEVFLSLVGVLVVGALGIERSLVSSSACIFFADRLLSSCT